MCDTCQLLVQVHMLFTLQLRDQSTCGLKDAGGGSAIDSATNFANELAEHKSSC